MKTNKTVKVIKQSEGLGNFVLFVAWFGAAVYFIQQSEGFWGFILALLKACVWPAYVLYHVLQALNV